MLVKINIDQCSHLIIEVRDAVNQYFYVIEIEERALNCAKKNYLSQQFESDKINNIEKWRFFKNLITKKNIEEIISTIKKDDLEITDPLEIAENLNQFFVSVGDTLAQTLPESTQNYRSYFNETLQNR